jgi:transcriptional regulator with XRE-family HTH domain
LCLLPSNGRNFTRYFLEITFQRSKYYRLCDSLSIAFAFVFCITIAIMKTLGERLKKARLTYKPKRLTQKEVAARAGVSQTTVADIERGRNDGSKYLAGLAYAVNCSLNWLATSKGEMRGSDIPDHPRHETDPIEENLTKEQRQFLSLIANIDNEAREAFLKIGTLLARRLPERRRENISPHDGRRFGEINYRDSVRNGTLIKRKINEKRKKEK